MAVITISREISSGGSYIAKQVAGILHYHLVDKHTLQRIFSQYGFVQFEEQYESVSSFWQKLDANRSTMIALLNRTIGAVAKHGDVVILGRGGYAVLQDYADVLNVRIQAPMAFRVKTVMTEQKIFDAAKAEALVKENDRVRDTFLQSWYGLKWDVSTPFDLVVDTEKFPRDLVVRWILEAHKALIEGNFGKTPVTSSIEVDTILANAVREVMSEPVSTAA